jgi:two-component system, OmpR family, copper resistance phosphate regulon response regulator CusR
MNVSSKILLVEDEHKVASFILQGLKEKGYLCDWADDGKKGLELALAGNYDLVILDLILPVMHGLEVCRRIRIKDSKVKIIMLTAMGTLDDKLKGFGNGADDYLVKPFEFPELLARVKSLTRRIGDQIIDKEIISSNGLVVNLTEKSVFRDGEKISLTAKEFTLLEYLLRNKGKVVKRLDIAEHVWDVNFDTGTNVIDVYINFLRKKIDHGHQKKYIHTLIGMGYILKDYDKVEL